ncbi:MAG: UDP-N-acetylmuramate dehydrogenase [Pseudomonadota bacterium]
MLDIVRGPRLAERTSLRLGGTALAEVRMTSLADLDALPHCLARLGGEPVVLGYGTNILAHDGDLPLVIVSPKFTDDTREDAELLVGGKADGCIDGVSHCIVSVAASMSLPRLLARLAVWGLSGLEGLAGVPSSVGGAVAMNAGSYGYEMGPALYSVTIFTPRLGLVTLKQGEFSFAYRHFKPHCVGEHEWFMVVRVELALRPASSQSIKAHMRACHEKKRATQPIWAHSAGCIFRNPVDEAGQSISAGKLLDEAGMKGISIGHMAMSEVHANFLVNNAQGYEGCSADAFALLDMAKERVFDKFGITLACEVRVLPCPY